MAKKIKETKAVLISSGETEDFELIKSDIVKETFEEKKFKKGQTTSTYGPDIFGKSVSNDTIKIGDQDVYAIAFEDGSVYVAGKGFIEGDHSAYVKDRVKALAPKSAPVEKADKVPAAKKVKETKAAEPAKETPKPSEEKA